MEFVGNSKYLLYSFHFSCEQWLFFLTSYLSFSFLFYSIYTLSIERFCVLNFIIIITNFFVKYKLIMPLSIQNPFMALHYLRTKFYSPTKSGFNLLFQLYLHIYKPSHQTKDFLNTLFILSLSCLSAYGTLFLEYVKNVI